MILLGNNLIRARSVKQRLVSKSSSESELIAIDDALNSVIEISNLCKELNIYNVPTLYQDNLSTIQMIKNGKQFDGRSSHIRKRYYYIKELVSNKEINLEHMPTEFMKADILTKPLTGYLFKKMKQWILNNEEGID